MDIKEIIREKIYEIIPELKEENISDDQEFEDMGLNSIDRAEMITLTLEELELDISRSELAFSDTINDMANVIKSKMA